MSQRTLSIPMTFPCVVSRLYELTQPTRYVRALLVALQNVSSKEDASLNDIASPSTPPLRLCSYETMLRPDMEAEGTATFRLVFPTSDHDLLNFVSDFLLHPDDNLPGGMSGIAYREALAVSTFSELITALVYIDIVYKCCGSVEPALNNLSNYWSGLVQSTAAQAQKESVKSSGSVGRDLHFKLSHKWTGIADVAQLRMEQEDNQALFIKWLIKRDIAQAKQQPQPKKETRTVKARRTNPDPDTKIDFRAHLSLRGDGVDLERRKSDDKSRGNWKDNSAILEWLESRGWLEYGSYADRYIAQSINEGWLLSDKISFYVAALICAYVDEENNSLQFTSVADID